MRIQSVVAAALLGATLVTASAQAAYSRVFVFGDSLSDNGNAFILLNGQTEQQPYTDLIPDEPYASRTLSNGPIWVDRLPARVSAATPPPAASLFPGFDFAAGANFAVGAARSGPLTGVTPNGVPTLLDQVNGLLTVSPNLPSDALYIAWAAGNDARDALELAQATGNPAAAAAVLQSALFNMDDVLGALAASGAQHLLVLNMPDVSRTPAVAAVDAARGDTLASSAVLSFVEAYNDGLAQLVSVFEADTGIDVLTLDMFDLITQVLDDPAGFGFTNTTAPCIFENAGQGCASPEDYFFWDGLHPDRKSVV